MTLPKQLTSSIENLYLVFKRYSRPLRADVSPYAGIREADIERLASRPLRELQPQDVQAYARHALTTWGDDREFRHYLPRLFELLTEGPHCLDVELLIGKLDPEWTTWPEDERSALLRFLDALWDWALETYPDKIAARDILRGLGALGRDLGPFLERWRHAKSHASGVQLASFVLYEEPDLRAGAPVQSFWRPNDPEQVSRFLLAPETRAKLEAAHRAEPAHPSARDLSDALEVLEAAGVGPSSG